MNQSILWLIDASYLQKSAPGHLDYLKLKRLLVNLNETELKESYYFNSVSLPVNPSLHQFHTWLKSADPYGPQIRIKLYDQKTMPAFCGACKDKTFIQVQKGVDVGIATMMVKKAAFRQFDRLILTAGDGDFLDSLAFVKEEMQLEVWLTGFMDTVSADLQAYSDRVIWLNDHWDEIAKQNGNEQPRKQAFG